MQETRIGIHTFVVRQNVSDQQCDHCGWIFIEFRNTFEFTPSEQGSTGKHLSCSLRQCARCGRRYDPTSWALARQAPRSSAESTRTPATKGRAGERGRTRSGPRVVSTFGTR